MILRTGSLLRSILALNSAGPCYDHPLACKDSATPDRVNVMLQFPYLRPLCAQRGPVCRDAAEYGYTKAPRSMKRDVAAPDLLAVAVASSLGIAMSRAAVDPGLFIMYTVLAAVWFVVTLAFYCFCRSYDDLEDELFDLNARE